MKFRCAGCEIEYESLPNQKKTWPFCERCRGKLQALLTNTRSEQGYDAHGYKNVLTLTNIKLNTSIQGTPYVLAIDGSGSDGWQWPIGIDGEVKCLICDELTEKMICDRCRDAVKVLREWGEGSNLMHFLTVLKDDAIRKWMQNELERLIDDSD